MACGLCLLIAPALLLVGGLVDPSDNSGGGDEGTRNYLQSLKDDPDGAQLSTALFIVGFALLVIGLIGLVHVIRDRGVVLANIGGALAILGSVFFTALVATTLADLNTAEHLDIETARKLNNDIEDYWAAYVVFIPALLGTFVGLILLGAAVIRSGVAHLAAGILIILAVVLLPASDGNDVVGAISGVLLLAGLGLVGLKILGMTDEQWEGRA